jgi:hypothetical protein
VTFPIFPPFSSYLLLLFRPPERLRLPAERARELLELRLLELRPELERLRLVLLRPVLLRPVLLRLVLLPLVLLPLVLLRLLPDLRRRVEAAFRAEELREDLDREAEARPPFLPPFREELRLVFFPRPDPLFFPPPVSLFTVAQARRSASLRDAPRFSYPSSMCSAWRFCFLV